MSASNIQLTRPPPRSPPSISGPKRNPTETGENTAIAAQSGIAGSTKIGKNCMIGGQVGIIGHLKIGDNVKIQAQAGVTSDVESNARITGTPAIPFMNYNKSYIHFKNLPEIVKKIDKRD